MDSDLASFETPFLRRARVDAQAMTLLQHELGISIAEAIDSLIDSDKSIILKSENNHELHDLFTLYFFSFVLFHICAMSELNRSFSDSASGASANSEFVSAPYYLSQQSLLRDPQSIVLLQSQKRKGVPRRPILCHLRNRWFVHAIDFNNNNNRYWYECNDVMEGLLMWLTLVKRNHDSKLENSMSIEDMCRAVLI
jgi:hypothetical protein